jgi:hypothetical protein
MVKLVLSQREHEVCTRTKGRRGVRHRCVSKQEKCVKNIEKCLREGEKGVRKKGIISFGKNRRNVSEQKRRL